MNQLLKLHKVCKQSNSNFLWVAFRSLFHKLIYGKTVLLHQKVTINGIANIETGGRLEVGLTQTGFSHRSDHTYLNIRGKLKIKEHYSIGRGCRIDIGENAMVSIGKGGYINCNTNLVIMHSLIIGDHCAISWDCQFLDDDFHQISYDGKRHDNHAIVIGNHVWIGCGAKIYKGTVIPDGCVVASDSIVKGVFHQENSLIGGHPARVIKENISWK